MEVIPGRAEEVGKPVEIAVFVRVEHEAAAEEKGKADGEGEEKREDAFWCVLGVGEVAAR